MQLRHSLRALAALVGVVTIVAACSATTGGTHFTTTGGSGTGGGGSGSTGGGSGMGGGITLNSDAGGGTCTQTHCSADLHQVLDCNNNVVTTCTPDQGCGATGCVAACDAATQNKSTIGCDYYAVDPDIIADAKAACFAAYIANTWNGPVTIQVERGGQMLSNTIAYVPSGSGQSITYQPLTNGQLMPGQVAVVFLAGDPSAAIAPCPAGLNVGYPHDGSVGTTTASGSPSDSGWGQAFHITTSAPVVAYDIFPFGGGNAAATSATLLIPTTAWDTNYIAVDAYAQSQLASFENAAPFIEVVASVPNTHVTILPTVNIVGNSSVSPAISPGTANTPVTYTLANAGDYLQLTQPEELIGSVISADQPVGHWAGASCLNIPVDVAACDSAHQQIPPVKALGNEYVAVRYRNRFAGQEESPPWRMVGAVDGTILSYDPAAPTGAPLTLKQGQLVEFNANGPFTVKSQDTMHPFYMAAFMTGCQYTNPAEDDCRGDPEFVNVIPPQQYLSSYTFFTDPTYPETNLVLVRTKSTGQLEDVTLDCGGKVTGWAPVGAGGDYEYARVDLVTGDFTGVNGCDNGVHTIKSNGTFGLAVWGWGSAATGGSYGCSGSVCGGFYSHAVSYSSRAGATVQPINQVVIPPMPK